MLLCIISGKTFSKKETFGAFPLQVQGYGDLHDSLEGAMAQVEIEPVGPEGSHKSGQEVRYLPHRGREGSRAERRGEGREVEQRLF